MKEKERETRYGGKLVAGMADSSHEILSQAIARNSAAMLSLPSAGMLRHHKSRFLHEAPDGVWIESIPTEQALIEELIAGAQPCELSFKTGNQNVSFAATLLKSDAEFKVNTDTIVAALLIAHPAEVKAVQRRNNYRVKIYPGADIRVQAWRIPEHARLDDKPMKAAQLVVEIRDISIGGIGVTILPKDGEPPKILPDERVRLLLRQGDGEELLVEGRMRAPHTGPESDTIETGIQFKKLQDGLEGRRILSELTKMIAAMNREEIRRQRLGI